MKPPGGTTVDIDTAISLTRVDLPSVGILVPEQEGSQLLHTLTVDVCQVSPVDSHKNTMQHPADISADSELMAQT
ncbi:hypothetical protein ASF47_15800 [Nocardioides sp. Leaf285]|nr:hypothetical protein ASF47_15800 [Nocardioides sp. Leaf285]